MLFQTSYFFNNLFVLYIFSFLISFGSSWVFFIRLESSRLGDCPSTLIPWFSVWNFKRQDLSPKSSCNSPFLFKFESAYHYLFWYFKSDSNLKRKGELQLDFGDKSCLLKFQTENQGIKVLGQSPNLEDSSLIKKTQELPNEIRKEKIYKTNKLLKK